MASSDIAVAYLEGEACLAGIAGRANIDAEVSHACYLKLSLGQGVMTYQQQTGSIHHSLADADAKLMVPHFAARQIF